MDSDTYSGSEATKVRATKTPVQLGEIRALRASFLRSLAAQNKSPKTLEAYGDSVRFLADYLEARGPWVPNKPVKAQNAECRSPTTNPGAPTRQPWLLRKGYQRMILKLHVFIPVSPWASVASIRTV